MEGVRIAKLIASRGIASRREAEGWVEEGRVTVAGTVIDDPAFHVTEPSDVRVDGQPLPAEPPSVYYVIFKPKGTITGRDDPQGRKSVLDLVEHLPYRVEPVGRLDYDTEGALLLTNDGELANQLTHPSSEVPKRYHVKVYRTPSPKNLAAIRAGKVFLDDGPARPAKVRVLEATDRENAWVEITVTEGRNRLIRRVFEQLGHPVSKLRRETFATISIRDMERGQVRELTRAEVGRLQDLARGVRPKKAGRTRYKKGYARPKPKKKRLGQKARAKSKSNNLKRRN